MLRVNGFYGHVQKNHGRSIILFAGFAIACQIAIGVLMTVPIMLGGETNFIFVAPIQYLKAWGLHAFVVSALLFAMRYHFHTSLMKSAVGFENVTHNTHPRLVSIVTNHAIAAGVPIPAVGVIPHNALNAFACGLSKSHSTVVVTQGLLNALDDDELSAVIAHEIAHIMNGDMQMMAVANASMGTVDMINNLNPFKLRGGKSVFLAILFLPLLFMILMFGFAMSVANTITKVTRLLIASSREFIADAEAVRITHNPGALISALRKINGRSTIEGLDPMADAMMIDGAVDGSFATHPPISERIAVLSQLSGSMVHGQAQRNDSRSRAQIEAYNTERFGAARPAFGRAQLVEAHATASPQKPFYRRNLIDRVNADRGTNAFGISPKVGRMLFIGFMIFVGFQLLMMSRMNSIFSQMDLAPSPVLIEHTQNHTKIKSAIRLDEGNDSATHADTGRTLTIKTMPSEPTNISANSPVPALRGRKTDKTP